MKILEAKSGFTTQLNIGEYSFFIVVDKFGVDINIDDIISQAVFFSNIVIKGKEPLEEKDDIYKIVKKLVKHIPTIKIQLHTKGLIKPAGLSSYSNVHYYVNLQLKNSGLPFDDRVNDKVIRWFIESNAKFIFYIQSQDDLDEMEMLISEFSISKSRIYVVPDDKFNVQEYIILLHTVIKYCKIKGYNYSFNINKFIEGSKNE